MRILRSGAFAAVCEFARGVAVQRRLLPKPEYDPHCERVRVSRAPPRALGGPHAHVSHFVHVCSLFWSFISIINLFLLLFELICPQVTNLILNPDYDLTFILDSIPSSVWGHFTLYYYYY